MTAIPLALGMPGPFEWAIIGVIGLLLFGKRLPEVGRSVGKGIVEFKRGLKDVQQELVIEDEDKPLPPPPASRPLPPGTERSADAPVAAAPAATVESGNPS